MTIMLHWLFRYQTKLNEEAKEALRKFDAACGNRPKEEKEETPEKKKKGGWEKFKETIKETFERLVKREENL